jgi:TM2 domain-containing membrane protein YozV
MIQLRRSPKHLTVAIALAFAGIIMPGLHRIYLGQPGWGASYLIPGLLWAAFPIGLLVRVASVCDGLIYLFQGEETFQKRFNRGFEGELLSPKVEPNQVQLLVDAIRQLDTLRQDGLITEYEFEQQRRQLIGS